MNKTAIKNFAIWARNKLIADICYRAGLMGITEKGIADPLPQSTLDAQFYDIGAAEPYLVAGEAIKQRRQLVSAIREKEADTDYATAYQYIMEEVAYTWFNRLIAVRFHGGQRLSTLPPAGAFLRERQGGAGSGHHPL
jgi:hypothetical protein